MRSYNIYDILDDIRSDRKKKIIFDTDTYNEVDDQFAVAYAMLSPEKLEILGFVAAPFVNNRSTTAKYGMEQSYDELFRMRELVNPELNIPIFKGSEEYFGVAGATHSEGVDFMIKTALESDERIYIVGTGAASNIANAIALEPKIKDKIVVVWLGTHDYEVPDWNEFNMEQDVEAARVIFDSDVPVVIIPAYDSSSKIDMSQPELDAYLKGRNKLCNYLYEIVSEEIFPALASRREIYDIAATGTLVKPDAILFTVRPAPLLSNIGYNIIDNSRHSVLYATVRYRQAIVADMLEKFYTLK